MISQNIYFQLLIRTIVIILSSIGLAWILYSQTANILIIVPIVILTGSLFNTVYYLNSINRRIFHLFESIKNDDYSLSIPETGHTQIEEDLNKKLRELNEYIRNISSDLHKQEQYFQALIEKTATGIFTINSKGFVLNSNQQARKLLGLDTFTHIAQLEAINTRLFRAVQKISPGKQALIALQKEDSEVQLQIKASTFKSGDEKFTLLSIHDIRNELDEKEIESWRKIIRVMRHEIMNYVTPITSLSEGLIEYLRTDGKAKTPATINQDTIDTNLSGLEIINEQAQGLFRFVESYKKLARMPEPEPDSIHVNKLLENISIIARSFTNSETTQLVYNSVADDQTLFADEQQITQVLVNVVKNAFQAVENTKSAKVELIWETDKNGQKRIIISDNGPGIDADNIDNIFIPFFTTKENGSGIGLSLSKQIMQMHGGNIEISTVPGIKTSIILKF